MRGCTETDNTVVIGCYKADLGDRNRNGLRHCQFDPVSSGFQKCSSLAPLLTIIVYGALTAAREVFYISRSA